MLIPWLLYFATLTNALWKPCIDQQCTGDIINCPSNDACIIECIGTGSCANTTINCKQSTDCVVDCKEKNSCSHIIINGTNSQSLYMTSNGTESAPFSKVYCPINSPVPWISCIITGTENTSLSPMDIYISTSSIEEHDIIIECISHGDLTCARDVTLNCGPHYGQICEVESSVYFITYGTSPLPTVSPTSTSVSTTPSPIISTGNAQTSINLNTPWIYVTIGVTIVTFCICIVVYMIYLVKKRQVRNLKHLEQTGGTMGEYVDEDPDPEHAELEKATEMDYEHERKMQDIDRSKLKESVKKSDHNEVAMWLKFLELEEYYDNFRSNGYKSLKFVLQIRAESDLKEIGISLKGHQKMILNAINQMRKSQAERLNEGKKKDKGLLPETDDVHRVVDIEDPNESDKEMIGTHAQEMLE